MLKPLGQRELDAIRDDPIYFDGDHPDHDAYVAMVDGEYRRVYSPGLQQAMLKQDRPRLGPAAIQIKRTVGPDTARNDPNDVKVLKDAFDGLGAFDMGTKRKPGDASEDSKIRAAICGFQRAHGLKADCEVTPNGPTLKALRVAAAESNEEVPPVPRSKPPAPRDVWPPVPQRKPRPPAGDPGAIFLAGIRGAENSLLKSVHPVTAARGLYQITPGKLMDIGALTPEGAWNPSYYPGIETVDDFNTSTTCANTAGPPMQVNSRRSIERNSWQSKLACERSRTFLTSEGRRRSSLASVLLKRHVPGSTIVATMRT